MTLYEINKAIMDAIDNVDDETGEWLGADDFEQLQIDKADKELNVALYIKNLKAEKEAVKAEKENFTKREKMLENKIDRLTNYLQMSLNGNKINNARVQVSYRKSTSVECSDEWIEMARGFYPELVTIKEEVEPNKAEIKRAIQDGARFDGVVLLEKINMSVK